MKAAQRRLAGLAALVSILLLPTAAPAAAETLPSGFTDSVVFDNLEEPTAMAFAPDGRVFIAEKSGKILLYSGLYDGSPEVFDDLRTEVYDSGDRGLLGLAVDPQFTSGRPYVYALYTYDHVLGEAGGAPKWGKADQSGDPCPKPADVDVDACPVSGRLVRITATGNEAAAEKVLVEDWCQQNSSHSIGNLEFGPEGALFASGGEGASFIASDYGQYGWPLKNQCGDPPDPLGTALEVPEAEGGSLRSQDVLTPEKLGGVDPTGLDGSLIRIDPDTGEGLAGNPFAGSTDLNARRIIAFGFRNPFRFAINPATEEAYVANVGNGTDEEIDRFPLQPSQAYNSGWPCFEGAAVNPGFYWLPVDACDRLYEDPGSTGTPFLYYDHAAGVTPEDPCPYYYGSAISGAAFYAGGSYPSAYDGALFFADSVRGCMYVMRADGDGEPDPLTTAPFMTDAGPYPGVDIATGPGGDIFYTSLVGEGQGPYSGSIHRISYDPGAPAARLAADVRWGPLPLKVKFDAGDSTDPEDETLQYAWDLDGDGAFETPEGEERSREYKTAANRTVSVKVSDGSGSSSVAQVRIFPGDSPPAVEIDEPLETLTWGVGQQIDFSGAATTDSEAVGEDPGQPLEESKLYWKTRLYHCPGGSQGCHAHPLQVFPAVEEGELTAPDHDYPSKIELSLTATDDRGLSATKTFLLDARGVDLAVASEPAGVTLSAGTVTAPGPFGLTAIEDSHISLSAPKTAEIGGTIYLWQGWSDGGARVHSIVAAGPAEYTASYGLEPPAEEGGARPPAEPARPQTQLLKHPAKRMHGTTARFVFAADQGDAWFQCLLDQGVYRTCRSPRLFRHLRPGAHSLTIRALTPGGKEDQSPVAFRWKVLPPRPRG